MDTINFDIENKRVFIEFKYDSYIVSELKKVDIEKSYNPNLKRWNIKFSDLNEKSIELLNKFSEENDFKIFNLDKYFEYELKLKESFEVEKSQIKSLENEKKQEISKKYQFLKDYQTEGVLFLSSRKASYLGDTMGLGKTVQTLVACDIKNNFPVLIICPNSLKCNWVNEIEKFISNRSSEIITAKTKQISKDKDFYIINYDIIGKKLEQLIELNLKAVVLDESHYIKESKTARFKAIDKLIVNSNIENRILLSGTAITNRPKELLSQVLILDRLSCLAKNEFNFLEKYCNGKKTRFGWDFSGASNTKELHEKMTANFYLRREKENVLKELREKQYNTIQFEIDNRKEYNQAYNNLENYLMKIKDDDDDDVRDIGNAKHLVEIEVLKQLAVKGKLKSSIEWIEDFIENDEKLVLFCHHKEAIKELQGYFKDSLTIDGSTSIEDRQTAVDLFQNDISKKLIICSIKSAGVGLTLTASSNVAFLEFTWTPSDIDQCSDRVHRIGQKNNVNIYYLVAKDTIEDQKILPLIEKKRKIFNAVVRGEDVSAKDLKSSIIKDFIKEIKKDFRNKVKI